MTKVQSDILYMLLSFAQSLAYQKMQSKYTCPRACNEIVKYVNYASGPVRVLIAGEFKTGKSTFINALLGKELLKSDVLPATAIITHICYGEEEKITVYFKNGTCLNYSIDYLADISAETNNSYSEFRQGIDHICVFQKQEFLKYISIIDSPGINVTINTHNEIAKSVYDDVDFIIWVMSASQPVKRTEYEAIRALPDFLNTLVVFNRIDLIDAEEEDIDDVLMIAASKVKDISVATAGVSALKALEASKNKDNNMFNESRWPILVKEINRSIIARSNELKLNAFIYRIKNSVDKTFSKDINNKRKKLAELYDAIKRNPMAKIIEVYNWRKQRSLYRLITDDILKKIELECDDAKLSVEIKRVMSLGYAFSSLNYEGYAVGAFDMDNQNRIMSYLGYFNSIITQINNQYNEYMLNHSISKSELLNHVNYIIDVNKTYVNEYFRLLEIVNNTENELFKKNSERINKYKRDKEEYEALSYKMCMYDMAKQILDAIGIKDLS